MAQVSGQSCGQAARTTRSTPGTDIVLAIVGRADANPMAPGGQTRRLQDVGMAEHAPRNAMRDADEIARFHDRCSDLMRELLEALATTPDTPRTFPEVEDAMGWPRRRIASVLGGVARLRHTEFGGRRPYRFHDERHSSSGRWEIWMDATQARAVTDALRDQR
jgi:hypothetical protein